MKGISPRACGDRAENHGRQWVEVDPERTTMTCSNCGALSGPTGLSGLAVRSWECSERGVGHEREVKASLNIFRIGLRSSLKAPCNGEQKTGTHVRAETGALSSFCGLLFWISPRACGDRPAFLPNPSPERDIPTRMRRPSREPWPAVGRSGPGAYHHDLLELRGPLGSYGFEWACGKILGVLRARCGARKGGEGFP